MRDERKRRWRLVLGGAETETLAVQLGEADAGIDEALGSLYGEGRQGEGGQRGGLGASSPNVARWLGDIRSYFPSSVVEVLQRDALERLNLRRMLLEPELLAAMEPDVGLVATILSLNRVMPERTRETAREVVRQVVEDLRGRLDQPMQQAVLGALSRAVRNRRPRLGELDWDLTIRRNLKHYQSEFKAIIPQHLEGHGRRRSALRDVILAIDQSGSMATSIVYSGIFGAAMASMPALRTHLVVFDTSVVDLTSELDDPVDLLFATQLGGGTDIGAALAYCQGLVTRPQGTIMVLISDLFEGGLRERLLRRVASIRGSGVTVIVLLALTDQGRPAYDRDLALALHELDVPAFACTPDMFPDLMATAIRGDDIFQWAQARDIEINR